MQSVIEKVRNDPFARFLGVKVEAVGNGCARCSAIVQQHLLNFGGTPHGGFLFSLADVAFSLAACIEHMPSVALAVNGSFFKTAPVGAKLVAEARLVSSSTRFGYFLIEVKSGDELVATFNGTAYKSSGKP